MPTIKIINGPTVEPVTRERCWSHLRVPLLGSPPAPADAEDIADWLTTAREMAEKFTGLSLCPQTLEQSQDAFPADDAEIALLRGPVAGITSIVYIDADGAQQTMSDADYELDDADPKAPVVRLVGDAVWPGTKDVANAVKVRFTTGYSAPGDSPQTHPLPATIRSAILLTLGHLYEQRENTAPVELYEIPYGAECLLRPYSILNGFA